MKHLISAIIASCCLIFMLPQAQAKPAKTKATQAAKERLVLMPLRVAEEDKALQGAMETALAQGLQQKYEVFSGEQVAQKARVIFMKESRNTAKKECDEPRCMQGIAEAFQAELIATANVTKREDGYFLALSIQNIFDNKVEYSKSVPCRNCDAYQVVDKLKELSGAPTTAVATFESETTHAKVNSNVSETAKQAGQGPVMVRIPGKNYELGKYEVTQKEWQAVMGSNPSNFTSCGENCPVEQVSWDDIQIFLQKLNTKTGRQYRLPTEAEWEYACFGGSQTEYCGSNDINAVAWYDTGADSVSTHPAGQKQANGYGLYDMSGNVWEWMSDCRNGDCAKRIVRGGSWSYALQRVADRTWSGAASSVDSYGFRLARTLP